MAHLFYPFYVHFLFYKQLKKSKAMKIVAMIMIGGCISLSAFSQSSVIGDSKSSRDTKTGTLNGKTYKITFGKQTTSQSTLGSTTRRREDANDAGIKKDMNSDNTIDQGVNGQPGNMNDHKTMHGNNNKTMDHTHGSGTTTMDQNRNTQGTINDNSGTSGSTANQNRNAQGTINDNSGNGIYNGGTQDQNGNTQGTTNDISRQGTANDQNQSTQGTMNDNTGTGTQGTMNNNTGTGTQGTTTDPNRTTQGTRDNTIGTTGSQGTTQSQDRSTQGTTNDNNGMGTQGTTQNKNSNMEGTRNSTDRMSNPNGTYTSSDYTTYNQSMKGKTAEITFTDNEIQSSMLNDKNYKSCPYTVSSSGGGMLSFYSNCKNDAKINSQFSGMVEGRNISGSMTYTVPDGTMIRHEFTGTSVTTKKKKSLVTSEINN